MKGALLCVCLLVAGVCQGREFPVTSSCLSNGMRILVHEDHDIPSVALYFFFRVGSRNERPGIRGISHFLEHMMFKGAAAQFDTEMERNGGSDNAYTTRDVTVYSDWAPRPALRLVMRLEADRMAGLRFTPAAFESERDVVSEERRSTVDDDFPNLLFERLKSASYTVHPYGWPVIGSPEDIQAWSPADLREYFRAGYAPNNCLLAVVGDVTPADVLSLAAEYFAPIPRREPPAAVTAVEPRQKNERRVVVHRKAQAALALYGYHVPPSSHPDYWPLQILGTVLAEGRGSRLSRALVDTGQAISVDWWQTPSLDAGQLVFHLTPRRAVRLAEMERTFLGELERVAAGGVSADELERARNQLLTEHYRTLRTNSGKAEQLGDYEVYFGGYRSLFTVPERLQSVTAAEVRAAAARYLRAGNRTAATLVPTEPSR